VFYFAIKAIDFNVINSNSIAFLKYKCSRKPIDIILILFRYIPIAYNNIAISRALYRESRNYSIKEVYALTSPRYI